MSNINDSRKSSSTIDVKAGTMKPGIEFLFKNVNVNIKNTQILHNVSGIVHSGEVLAVMGPSGK